MPLFYTTLQKIWNKNFHDLDNVQYSIVQQFFVYVFHGQFQKQKIWSLPDQFVVIIILMLLKLKMIVALVQFIRYRINYGWAVFFDIATFYGRYLNIPFFTIILWLMWRIWNGKYLSSKETLDILNFKQIWLYEFFINDL